VRIGVLAVLCGGLGAVAAFWAPSFPAWEIGMLGFLFFGLVMRRVLGFAHPLTWMTTLYSLYFLLGAQDWVEPSQRLGFRNYITTEPTLRLAFFGLLLFVIGALATAGVRRHVSVRRNNIDTRDTQAARLARPAGALLSVVVLLGLLMSIRSGLPILHPAIRSEVNHGIWAACTYALVPAALLLTLIPTSIRRDLLIIGVYALLLLILAYRSPVILLISTVLILRLLQGRITPRSVIVGVVGLVVFSAVLFSYRVSAAVEGGYFVPSGPLREVPFLYPLYSGFAREGFAVMARLQELVPASVAAMHGKMQLSMFHFHTGELSPRQYVYNIIYGTTVARTTYTPTIIGGPYVDFGLLGVVSEMFVIGTVCGLLYRSAWRSDSPWRALGYSYGTALVVMAIHTGLLDDETLVIVPIMIVGSLFAARTVDAAGAMRRSRPALAGAVARGNTWRPMGGR